MLGSILAIKRVMKMENIHTAIHTIFGAAISIALSYDMKFNNINEVFYPLFALVVGVCAAVISELIRAKVIVNITWTKEAAFGAITLLLFVVAKIDAFGLSREGVVSFKPDPNGVFLALVLALWMFTIGATGFLQRKGLQ